MFYKGLEVLLIDPMARKVKKQQVLSSILLMVGSKNMDLAHSDKALKPVK